jgi:hypothetical protein
VSVIAALFAGASLLLAPDLPDLIGQCEVVQRFDGLEDKGINPLPRLPGFDDICAKAKAEIGVEDAPR